jgi:hypothetical protein
MNTLQSNFPYTTFWYVTPEAGRSILRIFLFEGRSTDQPMEIHVLGQDAEHPSLL